MADEEPPRAETGGHEWGPLTEPDEDGVVRAVALCCGRKAEIRLRHGEWKLVD